MGPRTDEATDDKGSIPAGAAPVKRGAGTPSTPRVTPVAETAAAWVAPLTRRTARRDVAGPDPAAAVDACRSFARSGFASTVGYWNADGEPPRWVVESYLALAQRLRATGLEPSLSVRAPALGFDWRLAGVIAECCRADGLGLHFDSLRPDVASRTLALIAKLRADVARLGCTLPGRWQRSLADAEVAIDLGLHVRVVKGEWDAPDGQGADPGDGFLAVVERLAGRARHVAVATHDWELARAALDCLRAASTSASVELLFGLPMWRAVAVASAAGAEVRVYVPYGRTRLP
jgi:proline dehydrogenase